MVNGSTVVKTCTCNSSYQNAVHGHGKRVMNVGGSKDSKTYYCTVCGVKHKK